jgi:hypothetical protein
MFWQIYESKNTKEIEDALNNEASTLETFLQLDDIANEIRINTKLASHFGPIYVQGLIDYVTQMPKETDSDLKKFRFPFVAAELLKADCQNIQNSVFSLKPEEEPEKKSPSNDSDVQLDESSPMKDDQIKPVEKEVASPTLPKEESKNDIASPSNTPK